MTDPSSWPPPQPTSSKPATSPAPTEWGELRPSELLAGVTIPPVWMIPAGDDAPWQLFVPTGFPYLPTLREQFETLVAFTAEAVEEFAERFRVGPVSYPPVTLVSSPATRDDVHGVAVYMFSMIARVESGDPFEGIRSIAHAHLNWAWNAAVRVDITTALRNLCSACVAIEGQSATLRDDVADLVLVGTHIVSLLDNVAGVIDKH